MKKNLIFLLFLIITFVAEGQITLKYSGTASQTVSGYGISKLATINETNISNVQEVVPNHFGSYSSATNGSTYNIGVFGTTKKNTVGTGNIYVGVMGDNANNTLNANNTTALGVYFLSKNSGANSISIGVGAESTGQNNTTVVLGVNANASNTSNTTPNQVIAVKGVSTSGQSTISYSPAFKAITNPGGYFSGNDGQGLFATATTGYNLTIAPNVTFTAAQAITGYINIDNTYISTGIVGSVDGASTGIKYGVYGVASGGASVYQSAGIYGADNVLASNSYAAYFDGKVNINGNLLTNSISPSTGNLTTINNNLSVTNKLSVGTNTVNATEQMEVNGRLRIRSNTYTAGLWLNNSANSTAITDGAFVGMETETPGSETVGFWLNGSFRFFVDRSGNSITTGEIRRPQTSDANMVPIAYGNVSSAAGTLNTSSSTSNVTCVKTATGVYEVTIAGESFATSTYTAIASLNQFNSFGFISTGSSAGKLIIYTANTSGVATDSFFTFAIYKK